MHTLFLWLLPLLAGALFAPSATAAAQTPQQRRAILDTLRDEVRERYGREVMFQVHRLNVQGGTATAEVTCIEPKASDSSKEVVIKSIPRLRATVAMARRGLWQVTALEEVGTRRAKAAKPPKRSAGVTPTPDERKAILDALRIELVAAYNRPILFAVRQIKVFRPQREAVVEVRRLRPISDDEGEPYPDIAPIRAILNVDRNGNWGVSEWGGPEDFPYN